METHLSQESIKSSWSEEYKRKGIPSSYRKDPTKVVVTFLKRLGEQKKLTGRALDLGCGLGRNSFYLAEQGFSVTAFDLLGENALYVNREALERNLPVEAFALDLGSTWPPFENAFDVAIDVFCYKHITCKKKQKKYRESLSKALKSDGYYFLSLASDRDGFYGPLLKASPNLEEKLIIDPHSKIPSFLYSMDDVEEEFRDYFEIISKEEVISLSPMYGKEYERRVLNITMKSNF